METVPVTQFAALEIDPVDKPANQKSRKEKIMLEMKQVAEIPRAPPWVKEFMASFQLGMRECSQALDRASEIANLKIDNSGKGDGEQQGYENVPYIASSGELVYPVTIHFGF